MTEQANTGGVEHYKGLVKRGGLIVVLTMVAVTVVGVTYAKRQPALYEASAEVFVSPQGISSLSAEGFGSGEPDRVLATQAALARLPEVLDRARTLAGLPAGAAVGTSVTPSPSADLMTFAATAGNPAVAARFARAYARAFVGFRRRLDSSALQQARAKVRERLRELRTASPARRQSQGYSDLIAREEDLRSRQKSAGENASIGSVGGAVQTQPNPKRNGFLAAMLGLMLGIALAFLRERLSTRVRSAPEIEEDLGVPLVGRVPAPPKQLRRGAALTMLAEPDSPHAEAIRVLAMNLEYVNKDSGASSIMFTSAHADEGKTTTVANLAVALARFGRRVVLVDLDLRRPAIDRFFDLSGKPGLTDVLFGEKELDEALVRFPVTPAYAKQNGRPGGCLKVLTSGPLLPNAADILASHALDDLMEKLEQHGDIVLVDTPPILQVADAISISSKVDSVLIAAMLSKVKRPALLELRRVLAMTPVARLGVVVTGSDADEASYSYRYGYKGREFVQERTTVR